MKFTDYLKSKRNILIVWFVIHGFALFVNVFHLQGEIESEYDSERINELFSHVTDKHIFLFTDKSWKFYRGRDSYQSFWPFSIKYQSNGESQVYFSGIFYNYDISEFIAYSILIFLFLYTVWEFDLKINLINKKTLGTLLILTGVGKLFWSIIRFEKELNNAIFDFVISLILCSLGIFFLLKNKSKIESKK